MTAIYALIVVVAGANPAAAWEQDESGAFPKTSPAAVAARDETEPVAQGGDSADDPAIWVHPTDSSLSLILGTEKDDRSGGLYVYNLDGSVRAFHQAGEYNNVDLRYAMPLGGDRVDIAAASNRTLNTIELWRIDPERRSLHPVGSIQCGIKVYGLGMYHSRATGTFYALVNSKKGEVEQWQLVEQNGGRIGGRLVRSFDVGSQTEGVAADDELGQLYIGEEGRGIWKYGAEPDDNRPRTLVDTTGPGGHLQADVEGLAIYYRRDGRGYLLASSQGDDTVAVYRREGDNDYLGSFRVVDGPCDKVTGTDGLDAVNMPLGDRYPRGLVVMHDGKNPGGNQNFKLIAWDEVAAEGKLGLAVDATGWDVRPKRSAAATRP